MTPRLPAPRRQVRLGGVEIDNLNHGEAVDAIVALAISGGSHYVVTPNVDHLVLLRKDSDFRRAYAHATLRLADGMPLVALSRLLGTPLQERVTGSDLIEPICALAVARNLRVYLLGGPPGAARLAARRLIARHPGLQITTACPNLDPGSEPEATQATVDDINRVRPNILFLGIGSPKQERWISTHLPELPPLVAVCVGSAIEFLSGLKSRAPAAWQRLGLEWLYRLLQEPRRLAPRYLVRDPAFLVIAARELSASHRRRVGSPDQSAARCHDA